MYTDNKHSAPNSFVNPVVQQLMQKLPNKLLLVSTFITLLAALILLVTGLAVKIPVSVTAGVIAQHNNMVKLAVPVTQQPLIAAGQKVKIYYESTNGAKRHMVNGIIKKAVLRDSTGMVTSIAEITRDNNWPAWPNGFTATAEIHITEQPFVKKIIH
jgi:hypothetical protein